MTIEQLLHKVRVMLGPRFPGLTPEEILAHITAGPIDLAILERTSALTTYVTVMGELRGLDGAREWVDELLSMVPATAPPSSPAATA
jgi:hypothetical protein